MLFDRLQRWRLARNLRSTLGADSLQPVGWEAWLEAARSARELRCTCPEPGWLVHVAYWSSARQDALLDGALRVAAIAWDLPHLASVLSREQRTRIVEWRTGSFERLPTLVAELERRSSRVAEVLASPVFRVGLLHAMDIDDARARPTTGDVAIDSGATSAYRGSAPRDERAPQPRDDAAAASALVAAAAMNRETGHRDALTTAAAGAAALFARAAPDAKTAMLGALRTAFGWQG